MHSQAVVARLLAQVAALRAELSRTQHELRLWQAQLNLAQKEILRAQQVVDEVDRARADAEERSHRYRQSLRRLLDERAVQVARDEGRHRGYHEGFQFAAAHPPVPVPPEQIRPHTNLRRPRMTLPERIADEWRSQNRPVSSSGFRRPNEPLPQRPATTAPRVVHIAVESPSIPPSNNTERTVVDTGLLSPHQPFRPVKPSSSFVSKHNPQPIPSSFEYHPSQPSSSFASKQHDPSHSVKQPIPSSSSFASKQHDRVPSSSSFVSKQHDRVPSSSSFASKQYEHSQPIPSSSSFTPEQYDHSSSFVSKHDPQPIPSSSSFTSKQHDPPHSSHQPIPSSSSFTSKQYDHSSSSKQPIPSSSSFASQQHDPQPIPSSFPSHQVYAPALSPIPALYSLAAIPETTSSPSYPNSLSSSVPVPGASSVDSRDV
ncbi:hypothetical protein Agabi119p4_3831 [Agaricus bisporus var. burnettii]|uniref:Uncharacterized protein n=1 Tax=Agaricus bisporus var. burnettii TaxID=192524 RepID=A0A8H7KIC2_AGABI|nr:hypothetical protein Agabi119p4_3831 [Agaricus bisporus var. burnettii]